MLSAREVAAIWAFSLVYTAYVVGVIFGAIALFGEWPGGAVGFVCAITPLIAGSFWVLRR